MFGLLEKYRVFLKILAFFFTSFGVVMYANAEFLVAIDIGHTLSNPGATSARGKKEFYFNKKMAIIVDEEIKNTQGLSSFIINLEGASIALKDRTKIAETKKADMFLSLHHDSVQPHYLHEWTYKQKEVLYSDNFEGYSIFISSKNIKEEDSINIATSIGEKLLGIGLKPTLHHSEPIAGENRTLLDKEKGVYKFNDLVVLKTASMPAILLECGIIVNRKEELLVSGNEFKREVAQAIVKAIIQIRPSLSIGMR
jgi:N-acetylmuramoyl-L-alanine amidase